MRVQLLSFLLLSATGCYFVSDIVTTIKPKDQFLAIRTCQLWAGAGGSLWPENCQWTVVPLRPVLLRPEKAEPRD